MSKNKIQEYQYNFPYHYIPEFKEGFREHLVWTWGINYSSTLEFILENLKSIDPKKIVDIGCGDGRLIKEISLAFPNKTVKGIDNSKKAINLARALNPKLDFQEIDILKTKWGETFDAATLIEVFEHIPKNKCKLFAKKVSNLIQKNGILIITVPHKNKPLQQKHYQHFDKNSLFSYFSNNFDKVSVVYFEKRNILSVILKKILSNSMFTLNNNYLNDMVYKIYKKYCFFADNINSGRIFFILKKK